MKVNKMPSSNKPLISCQLTVHILFLLILQFLWSADGAVYKLDPENPQGLLVQNAKKSMAYIFVPPHTSQSTGLAVQSLKLEAQLRWAKIPYHKISNQFFLGSPTDGSTPFMQYNGQYFEGANNIYRHLKDEWAERRKLSKMPADGEVGEGVGGQKIRPAAIQEKEERNSLSVGPKWKVAAANAFAKMKAIGPKQKMIKETEILQSAKVMTNILIADRIFRYDQFSGGLTYMFEDEGLKQQIAPILFALREEEKARRNGREGGGGSTSAAAGTTALLDGGEGKQQLQTQHGSVSGSGSGRGEIAAAENVAEKAAAAMESNMAKSNDQMPVPEEELKDPEAEKKRLAKGKGKMPEEEEVEDVPLPKKVRLLDRAFLKEYFALRNAMPSAQQSFLLRHQSLLLAEHFEIFDIDHNQYKNAVEKPKIFWHHFDDWLQRQIQLELQPFLMDLDHGVESSWYDFLVYTPASVHEPGVFTDTIVTKSYSKCGQGELMQIFNKAVEPVNEILSKHFQQNKTTFLFGHEPTEADALLFAVLLHYIRLQEHLLNIHGLTKYFGYNRYAEPLGLMRQYVLKMLHTLEMDPMWTSKIVPSPWKLNEPKRLMEWKGTNKEENDAELLDLGLVFYGEKYNGQYSIAKTDDLFWLLDFDLFHINSKKNRQLLIKNGANANAELLNLVLKELVGYMRTSKFRWDEDAVGKYGSDLLHLVAAYLCSLSGQEVPRGVLEIKRPTENPGQSAIPDQVVPETITEEAERCSKMHLGGMTDWRTHLEGFGPSMFKDWMVGIRRIIYEVVLEYNEKLVEEKVEQAILEAAKRGRRSGFGQGIEMF